MDGMEQTKVEYHVFARQDIMNRDVALDFTIDNATDEEIKSFCTTLTKDELTECVYARKVINRPGKNTQVEEIFSWMKE